jgi:hypothetical protein
MPWIENLGPDCVLYDFYTNGVVYSHRIYTHFRTTIPPQTEPIPMRQDTRNAETDSGESPFAGVEKSNPPTAQEIYFEIGVLLCIPLVAALIFEILLS